MNIANLPINAKVLLLLLHFLMGGATLYMPLLSSFFVLLTSIVALLYLLVSRNKSELVMYYVMYLLGFEVFSRMVMAIVFWEFTKYITVLLLGIAWLSEKRSEKKLCKPIVAYFLLLLPAVVVSAQYLSMHDLRKQVSFNLSGPLCLCISAIYFYKRKINIQDIAGYTFCFILPIISMSAVMLFRMPTLAEAEFGTYANFAFSGGYGPNQVASILSAAVFLLALVMLLKGKTCGFVIDIALCVFLLALTYFTFSRGGVMVMVVSLFLGIMSIQLGSEMTGRNLRWFVVVGAMFLVLMQVWFSINQASDGALADRYAETWDAPTGGALPSFTGRSELFLKDLDVFYDHFWTGCGVGRSKNFHGEVNNGLAAHTEYSRMMAEHGILGFMAILIFFYLPVETILLCRNRDARLYAVSLFVFAILTMAHSATRLTVPLVLYSFALARLEYQKEG